MPTQSQRARAAHEGSPQFTAQCEHGGHAPGAISWRRATRDAVRHTLVSFAALLGLGCQSSVPGPGPAPRPGEPIRQAPANNAADAATTSAHAHAPERLVIVIVIDQMRHEMLARLGPTWSGGLHRAFEQGLVFDDAHHAHASTLTAPGHASIATGTYPFKHGIAANDWPVPAPSGREQVPEQRPQQDPALARRGLEERSAAYDASATPLLPGGFAGGPAALRRDALGDWLLAQRPGAQVWSLAMKDRAAIMMGGRAPTGALWWDRDALRYTSSDRYLPALPAWAQAFDAALDLSAAGAVWAIDPSSPPTRSRDDAFAHEGKHDRFPHSAAEHRRGVGDWLRYHPLGDTRTLQLALALIDAQGLGADDTPDLLWLGLSSGDWIGHRNGPNSVEIELYYRAIDLALGDFFDGLDARGLAPVVVITSDHGVADIPQYAAQLGRDALRFDPDPELAELTAQLRATHACPDPLLELWEDRGIRVGTPALVGKARDNCLIAVAQALETLPWCEAAYPAPLFEGRLEARLGPPADGPLAMYARSYVPGRSPEISIRLRPGYLFERGYKSGTAHGSAYAYDTHVPWVFFAPGRERPLPGSDQGPARVFPAAHRAESVELVALAPTLAVLMGLSLPADLDGRPLDLSSTPNTGEHP